MDWCEDNDVSYVFGLTGTKALAAKVKDIADTILALRALGDKDSMRGFAETAHAAKSWRQQRCVAFRVEASPPWPRYLLRGHEHRHGHARMPLRRAVLRPRTGRKLDQAPQRPARLRPYLVPEPRRQPDAARPVHCCLLADAHRARGRPDRAPPRQGRVCNNPPPAA